MAEYKLIPVLALQRPQNPMREESLWEGIEELKESMAANGLEQPIGVIERRPGEEYEIVWGDRRSLAATQLGWTDIMAKVYQPGEGDPEMLKAHENFHRTELSPLEEAKFYRSLQERYEISAAEVARRCRKDPTRVSKYLSLLEGDPGVAEAVNRGDISVAQAREINRIGDTIGRSQALRYARDNGLSATFIRRWAEQRQASGIEQNSEAVAEAIANQPRIDYATMARCQLHMEYVELMKAPPRIICEDCWLLILDAITHLKTCSAQADMQQSA